MIIIKSPVTNRKETEIYEVHGKELKITILKRIGELQKNMDKQLN